MLLLFYFGQLFVAFTLQFHRINANEIQAKMDSPPPPFQRNLATAEVIVRLRANSFNISAFVPNHPGGPAVLHLVNGQDVEEYIEGRKCALGMCHRHLYAYQVLSQFEMPSDVIIGVENQFYNITAFVPNHPGGPFVLKAVNGQQNVEQYLDGTKCVFGICHQHNNAYEVLSQLEMSSINSAFSAANHHKKLSNASSLIIHRPIDEEEINTKQRQLEMAKHDKVGESTKKSDKRKTNEPTNGRRNEFGFPNDQTHHQLKEMVKKPADNTMPNTNNPTTAEHQKYGINNQKLPSANIEKRVHSRIKYVNTMAKQNATKSQQFNGGTAKNNDTSESGTKIGPIGNWQKVGKQTETKTDSKRR